jgi:hypothetical protein
MPFGHKQTGGPNEPWSFGPGGLRARHGDAFLADLPIIGQDVSGCPKISLGQPDTLGCYELLTE